MRSISQSEHCALFVFLFVSSRSVSPPLCVPFRRTILIEQLGRCRCSTRNKTSHAQRRSDRALSGTLALVLCDPSPREQQQAQRDHARRVIARDRPPPALRRLQQCRAGRDGSPGAPLEADASAHQRSKVRSRAQLSRQAQVHAQARLVTGSGLVGSLERE